MLREFDDSICRKGLAFTDSSLRSGEVTWFHFKCEDFSEDGNEIGPVYAVLRDKAELQSVRYVTRTDAMKLAKFYGVELVES